MSNIRERLLKNNVNNYSTIRSRLGLKEEKFYQKVINKPETNEKDIKNFSLNPFKKSSAFDDGYQFGDVTKTIGATAGDLAINIGKGFLNTVEGVADAGQYLLADATKGLSKVKLLDVLDKNAREWLKEKADALEENAKFDSTGAIFGDNEKESDNLFKKGWSEELDKNSVSGTMFDSVAQGVGNVAAMAGTGYLGGSMLGIGSTATSFLNSFSSAFGNAKSEAYKNGADDKTAFETATVSGFAEAISEQFFDALPGMKVEGWGSKLTGKIGNVVSKHFGTKAGKLTLKALDSVGEGAEEVISNALNAIGNDIVHYLDRDYDYGMEEQTGNIFKDTKNAVLSEDSLASFISASLTSAIINGGNTFITESQKKDIIKAYASDNNMTIDEVTDKFNDVVESNTNNKLNNKNNFKDKVDLESEETARLLNLIKNNNIDLREYVSEQKRIQEQLASIQNQNENTSNNINTVDVNNSSNNQNTVPTVQDIVNMENRQKSNIELSIFNNSNSNVELSLKEQQNNIIQNSNPIEDDYHTWIRSADDIKTFEETLNDSDYKEYFEAGENFDETYTAEMAKEALETGKITVYSSYPIEQGTFVSPSKIEAESYSGNGKVYSKEVSLTDVAWIDPTQGQYAKVSSKIAPVIDTTSVNNTNTVIAPVDNNLSNKINQNNIKSDLNYSSNTSLSFSEQLDLWVQGKWNNRSQLVLFKHTPQLYLELGLKDNPITVSSSKLDRIINASGKQNGTYHNLGLETTKQLPNAIANPLNILESSTVDDSIVVVTELSDKEGRIVIVSMAIDGKGHIEVTDINNNKEIKRLNSNVMTSAYGRNNYEAWMESNRDRMIYDKDDGIIKKRINGEWLQLPKGINPFVDNNISQTNKNVKSSGTLSTINDMQNNENNTNNLAPTREYFDGKDTKKVNFPSVKYNDKVKMIKNITEQINKTGNADFEERSWITTSTESDILKDKILIEDLDVSKLNYEVQSNKKSLEKANKKMESMGYDKSLEYVSQLIYNEKLPSASDMALAQRVLQEAVKKKDVKTAQTLLMDIAILGTDLGQATQALSIIQKLTPEGQLKLYTRIVQRAKARGEKSFNDVEITEEMVKKILDAYNEDGTFSQDDLNARVEEFKQDIAKQLKATTSDKVNAWRYLSMLGNPKTHIRNMVSNVAMKYTVKVKNAIARTLEDILPIENKTKTWKKSSDVVKKYANDTAIEMKSIITGEAKYNEKSSLEAKKQIFKNKGLEAMRNFNSKALETEDWWFSKNAFKTTFQEYLTANGIQSQEDINNHPEIVEKGKQYAVEQAEIATFRQYSKLASEISRIERNNKFAKYAIGATMPFKKTPINVAKTGLNYSPLGLIKNISYDVYQLKKGNIEASQFIDNISQGLTGTSLSLLGLALAKAGFLIGAGDDDKEGKYDSYLGKQSYALKIGDSTYSISWLSPVAMPLLVGANAYEKLENEEEWNADIILETLAETFDPISEMSFVSSLTDVLSSYSQGSTTMIKDMAETATQSYILQFFPTLFSQLASTLDSKKRSTKVSNDSSWKFGEETFRKIMYKIPGLRNQLEESTDIWGNVKEQSTNILERSFNNFLAPWSKSKDLSTKLDDEIKEIYNSTGESGVIPSIPTAYVKYKDVTYRMSADEYSDYKKIYGQKSNKYLNNLIKTSAYSNATDEEKANMIESIYKYAKVEANESFFKKTDVDYTSDTLNELQELRELNITDKTLAEYVSNKSAISSIKNNSSFGTEEKKQKISDLLVNSSLNDEHLAYLYGKYYSSEETLNNLIKANIPIKEFIKFNSQTFESDYYDNGKTISNSRKKKVINYINSLNLSVAQKAILIKMEYSSYNSYNSQIINYINNQNITISEKIEVLEDLGFKIRNGKVYSK